MPPHPFSIAKGNEKVNQKSLKTRAIAYCKFITIYYKFVTKRNIRKNVKVIKGGDCFDEGRTENIS